MQSPNIGVSQLSTHPHTKYTGRKTITNTRMSKNNWMLWSTVHNKRIRIRTQKCWCPEHWHSGEVDGNSLKSAYVEVVHSIFFFPRSLIADLLFTMKWNGNIIDFSIGEQ